MPILKATNINDTFNVGLMRINEFVQKYITHGSGWVFHRVEEVFLEIIKFSPKTGASHIPLPKDVASKKGVINPQNKDNECFRWAILCALYPVKQDAHRISKYQQYKDTLNFDNIEFPVQADEVILRHFERQNPTIALGIYEWKNRLNPIYVTDKETAENRKMISLLLIDNGEKQHYCWIKNMSRLISQRTKNCNKTFICEWCVSHFTQIEKIHNDHVKVCRGIKKNPQADTMPNKNKEEHIYNI